MMQITRCPPAFCAPSIQAQPLPKSDRQQLAGHYQKQEERREAKRKTSLAQCQSARKRGSDSLSMQLALTLGREGGRGAGRAWRGRTFAV